MYSCEFHEIFKNTYLIEHLWAVSSIFLEKPYEIYKLASMFLSFLYDYLLTKKQQQKTYLLLLDTWMIK